MNLESHLGRNDVSLSSFLKVQAVSLEWAAMGEMTLLNSAIHKMGFHIAVFPPKVSDLYSYINVWIEEGLLYRAAQVDACYF